jgi:hypothetical protein
LPIVFDPYQGAAGVSKFDHHTGRAGVESVLKQLLHDRRGTLDNLASGDLVGDAIG